MTDSPVLRVISGSPTPEELAVVTALMAASGGGEEPAPRVRRGGWNDPQALHRREIVPGPNAWRSSLR
jgi:hypothetical protein